MIHGRGTASREAERFFGISIQPDKEVVLILVPHDLTDKILHALYRAVGLKTPGQGIAFSLPVDQVVGLSTLSLEKSGEAPAGDGDADKS